MEQNKNLACPQAAADRHPQLSTEAEEGAYWRGYHAALAVAAQPAGEDSGSSRVRRMRIDGFSGEKQAVFLEQVAAGATVVEAARTAGISVTTVYNFRNRRAGRAFNIAWEAADRRARRLATISATARSPARQRRSATRTTISSPPNTASTTGSAWRC
jgi:hypothetical protein